VQKPSLWRNSVAHHTLSSYYRSLFAVLSSQLHAEQRHAGGLQGLLALLRAVPMMLVAVQEHAERQGISLAEHLGLHASGGSARQWSVSSGAASLSVADPGTARSGARECAAPASAGGGAPALEVVQ
jgi:hypothetical protein